MYEDEGTRGGVGRAEAARCGNGGKGTAAVIEGVRKRARVFVGDSIFRMTDRVLNKGEQLK